jgi:hypothetical protein
MTLEEKDNDSAGPGTRSEAEFVVADRNEADSLTRLHTMMREAFGVNLSCSQLSLPMHKAPVA